MPTDDTTPSPDETPRRHGLDPGELLAAGLRDDGAPGIDAMAEHFPQLDLIDVIGEGGMGIVYRARQRSLDREVALKVLTPPPGDPLAFAERFQREARALAKLEHPHIVRVYDHGTADGLHYLIMELVHGVNLRQAMQDGGLTPAQALRIVPQVCDALQFAHERGVVHRDIKPENVLLGKDGSVKIADFGLARMMSDEVDTRLTRRDQIMGTLHYMAPEQIESPDDVDHRADIYSLGVVLYEMLTGELPIGRFDPPSERVQVDVRLDRVVLRALAKQRDRRYQAAAEFKTDMEGGDVPAPPEPSSPVAETDTEVSGTPPVSPLAWLALASFVFALCIVAGTGILLSVEMPPVHRETYIEAWGLGGFLAVVMGIVTVTLGVIAAFKIRESEGKERGHRLAMSCVIAPFFAALVIGIAVGSAAPTIPSPGTTVGENVQVAPSGIHFYGTQDLHPDELSALDVDVAGLLARGLGYVHAPPQRRAEIPLGTLYHPRDAAKIGVMPDQERRRNGRAGALGLPMIPATGESVTVGDSTSVRTVSLSEDGRSAGVTLQFDDGRLVFAIRRGEAWSPDAPEDADFEDWRFSLSEVRFEPRNVVDGVICRSPGWDIASSKWRADIERIRRLHDEAVTFAISGGPPRSLDGLYVPEQEKRLREMQSNRLDELREIGRLGWALADVRSLPESILAYEEIWSIDLDEKGRTASVEVRGERSAIRFRCEIARVARTDLSVDLPEDMEQRAQFKDVWFLSSRPIEIIDFTK